MTGHSATSAMRLIDGATMKIASRRSDRPRLRRRAGGTAADGTDAASMALEGRQGLVHLRLRGLERLLRRHLPGQGRVDVLVDRLRDLRVDRRDRARLGLRD